MREKAYCFCFLCVDTVAAKMSLSCQCVHADANALTFNNTYGFIIIIIKFISGSSAHITVYTLYIKHRTQRNYKT